MSMGTVPGDRRDVFQRGGGTKFVVRLRQLARGPNADEVVMLPNVQPFGSPPQLL